MEYYQASYYDFDCEVLEGYNVYTIENKKFILIKTYKPSFLNKNDLITVDTKSDTRFFIPQLFLVNKFDFNYEFLINNPDDLFLIRLNATQEINNIFTEEELEHLKFLQKIER